MKHLWNIPLFAKRHKIHLKSLLLARKQENISHIWVYFIKTFCQICETFVKHAYFQIFICLLQKKYEQKLKKVLILFAQFKRNTQLCSRNICFFCHYYNDRCVNFSSTDRKCLTAIIFIFQFPSRPSPRIPLAKY